MADKEFIPEEVTEVERALASLTPRQSGIDRERLLYLAGRASVVQPLQVTSRKPRIWQLATTLSTTVAVLMGILLAVRGEPEVVREIQYEVRDRTHSQTRNVLHPQLTDGVTRGNPQDFTSHHTWNNEFSSEPNYLHLRTVALERGVDALASIPSGNSENIQNPSHYQPTMSYRNGLQDLLDLD